MAASFCTQCPTRWDINQVAPSELDMTNNVIFLSFRMLLQILLLVGVTLAEPTPDADAAIHTHGYGAAPAPYCANGGYCVPPVLCAPWYLESLYDPSAPCYLAHGTPGVCCAPKKPACE